VLARCRYRAQLALASPQGLLTAVEGSAVVGGPSLLGLLQLGVGGVGFRSRRLAAVGGSSGLNRGWGAATP
jgi:hypothetical protein